jgi:hypothetical protein
MYRESEGKKATLEELGDIKNSDLLRPLYLAIIMGPLAIFRDEPLIYTHTHGWHDHALYLVSDNIILIK